MYIPDYFKELSPELQREYRETIGPKIDEHIRDCCQIPVDTYRQRESEVFTLQKSVNEMFTELLDIRTPIFSVPVRFRPLLVDGTILGTNGKPTCILINSEEDDLTQDFTGIHETMHSLTFQANPKTYSLLQKIEPGELPEDAQQRLLLRFEGIGELGAAIYCQEKGLDDLSDSIIGKYQKYFMTSRDLNLAHLKAAIMEPVHKWESFAGLTELV